MIKIVAMSIAIVVLAGCAATPISPGAEHVRLTKAEPAKECTPLGDVIGEQGNLVSGATTSDNNLEIGATNDVKNKAAALGGNVVYILSDRMNPSGTAITISGTAYHCPQ